MQKTITVLLFIVVLFACKNKQKVTSESKYKQLKTKYATILNVPESEITNINLYLFIDDWYGTPYKYGGKDKNGIDCSGFTVQLFQSVYNKKLEPPASKIYEKCDHIKRENLKEGDLVFFKIESNTISHVGIYLANNKFIHSSTSKGVIINSLEEAYYKKYYFKGGRLK